VLRAVVVVPWGAVVVPWIAVAGAAVLAAAAAHAATGTRLALQRNAIHALVQRADADSLAAAAALSFRYNISPDAIELAVGAGELAPQDPVIGWLHLQLCVETPTCDFRDVATVLRWIDADNGASWLPILAAAYKDGDRTEVDRIIADMAQTKRFDVYWNPLVVLLADALYRARGDLPRGFAASDSARYELANGIAAQLLPPFASLLDSCRGAGMGPERREACLKLSRIMQHGDVVAAQMAGFGIEKRLLAADSKEGRAASERRRLLQWRMTAAANVDTSLPWLKNVRARKRLAQMRMKPREEDVDLAILREHRMATEPPEGQR
jgi:hypothetical protein